MALDIIRIAAPLIVGYLIGGIPFSLIVGKQFFGIDPRQYGSGNLGATNVFRVLGLRPALGVAAADVAKGAAAVLIAMLVCPPSITGDARDYVLIAVAMSAVLGHTYSPYIGFKGGKGVATAAGAITVVEPRVFPLLLITFVLVIALSRMVSLGSLTVAVLFPVLTWFIYGDRQALVVFSVVSAVLVIWRHRANIVRIWHGEESKLSFSARGQSSRVLLHQDETTSDGAYGDAAGPVEGSDTKDSEG